jgi:hypothetical protein
MCIAAPADMTPSRDPVPVFLGRAAVLLSEQEQLATTLGQLRELGAAIDAGASPLPPRLDPRLLIRRLKEEFVHHLALTDEWLRLVARTRPALLPAIVDLRSDHAAIGAALADLDEVVAEEARWGELPDALARILECLDVHCSAEALLVGNLTSQAPDVTS